MQINRLMHWVFLSGAFISGASVTVPALASSLSRAPAPMRLCKDVFGDDDDGDDVGDTSTAQPLCDDGSDDGNGDGGKDGDDGDDDSGDDTSQL